MEKTSAPQDTGLGRSTIDKYYTKSEIVDMCQTYIVSHLLSDGKDHTNDIAIEPSAGNGSFIKCIQTLGFAKENQILLDIEPEHPAITQSNYLVSEIGSIIGVSSTNSKAPPCIHVIGNPPFGRQSSLAIQFIKKSCTFCNTVSFILPRSFKKESMRKCFPKHFHIVLEVDIPPNSFMVNDEEHDVPCVFQIWVKKEHPRVMPKKPEPVGFTFVKKNETPDIAFRRVGVYAGSISREIENKSEQSHYFLKFHQELTEKKYNMFTNVDFPCKENTVGPRSISKPELIEVYNSIGRGDGSDVS